MTSSISSSCCELLAASRDNASRDRDDHAHRESSEPSSSVDDADSLLGIVRICSGLAYDSLKTRLVSYHCSRMGFSDCLNHSQSQSDSHSSASRTAHLAASIAPNVQPPAPARSLSPVHRLPSSTTFPPFHFRLETNLFQWNGPCSTG